VLFIRSVEPSVWGWKEVESRRSIRSILHIFR
jgi:hypothetical protein